MSDAWDPPPGGHSSQNFPDPPCVDAKRTDFPESLRERTSSLRSQARTVARGTRSSQGAAGNEHFLQSCVLLHDTV